MRRRPLRKPSISVSLFPFLAVLICTMGALIVLLVLVVHQARVHADTIADAVAQQNDEEQQAARAKLREEQEDVDWRREILEQQRTELTGQLADRRLELSHLEDHIRRLEARWKRLQAEAAELEKLRNAGGQDQASVRSKLARIQAEIAAERKRLDEVRQEAAERQRSFTIIAYRGPNGTRRRPIYIECTQSGIVIHPEGVVLQPADFAGPLGPGNPLDAALRTIREHWARVEGEANHGEPYPLLIVRPDGAVAYTMARAAMASWDDEFGYELVDADMILKYPPSDPTLQRLLEATIKTARQRQATLAAAMPSRFDRTAEPGDFTFREQPDEGGHSLGGIGDGSGAGIGVGTGGGRRPGRRSLGGDDRWAHQASRPGGGPSGQRPQPGAGMRPGQMTGGQRGQTGRPSGGQTGRPGGGQASGPSGGQTGGPSGGQTGGPSGGQPGRPSGGQAGGASGAQAGGSMGSQGAGASCSANGAAMSSMAKTKGANWALPKVVAHSTGITRPIAIQCYYDRLVILPDRGDHEQPQVIPVVGSVRGSIEQFVSTVWTHMDGWGMAVAGGYWKPVLKISVAPGADDRFRELEILLKDSGMEVERK